MMRKFAVRDADPGQHEGWDNGVVAFVYAPREDLAEAEVSRRLDTKKMSLVIEDVTDVPTYNWKARNGA